MKALSFLLDIDNTVTQRSDMVRMGKPVPHATRVLLRIAAHHKILLNTYRVETESDEPFDNALRYLEKNTVPVDQWMTKKIIPTDWDLDHAINVGEVFIDDMSFGIPLLPCSNPKDGKMVDWLKVEEQLVAKKLLPSKAY